MTEFTNADRQMLQDLKREQDFLREAMGGVESFEAFTSVDLHVFPGGKTPVRATDGAIGYDMYARAIVDEFTKPTEGQPLRRTRADFMKTKGWEKRMDEELYKWVVPDPTGSKEKYAIRVPQHERVMVGLGIATNMTFPLFHWVTPRSGFAAKWITVGNSPGTIDPDYRGEAGALMVNQSANEEEFVIFHEMRIIQALFQIAIIPRLNEVPIHSDLGSTIRGSGGFGSTGKDVL